MAKHFLLGVFDDDLVILEATKQIRGEGVKVNDVLSPFPIHGIDPVLGLKESNLHKAGFMMGSAGFLLMLSFMTWITTVDYPSVFGGKPYLSIPSYIPITFEFTVLCAAVGMVVAFFVRNGLSAIRPGEILDERITNDKFVMAFDKKGRSEEELEKITELLRQHGAIEVNHKSVNNYK